MRNRSRASGALALIALALSTAACSTRAGGSATNADFDRSVVRLVTPKDPPTLNTLITDNAGSEQLGPIVHGYLLGADAKGNAFPDLATVVPSRRNGGVSADGLTIHYILRHGIRWHDGAPFDARDVIFSFAAAMNPHNNVPDRSGYDDVAAVTQHGSYAIDVRLKHPYSPAVVTFFSLGANDPYPILPAHLLANLPDLNAADYNSHPIGLGPYKFVSWARGSRITFAADPHFRRGMPRIARVAITIVPDSNTALTQWQSGALDLYPVRGFSGTRALIDGARSVPDAREYASNHYQFNYLMFNVARGPLRDRRVREAIVRGVDKDRIERDVRGELYLAGSGDRLPGQFAYDPALTQPPHDPAAAARLLDAAGWKLQNGVRMRNGSPLALEIVGPAGLAGSERLDVQLQSALKQLGIEAPVKTYDYNLLFLPVSEHGIFATGRFDLTFFGWQPNANDDHSYLFRCDSRPPNGENYAGICDPRIDRDAAIELAATDPTIEARADRDMLRELDAQSDMDFLGFDRELLFARAELTGIKPSVLGLHYWNIDRWAWR